MFYPLIIVSENDFKQSDRELVPLTEGNMNISGDATDRAVHAPYDVTHNILGQ